MYAPTEAKSRKEFFLNLYPDIHGPNTILCGDFNSVLSTSDRISKKLDDMSDALNMLIRMANLCEPEGSKQFTYQHPLLNDRKSQIDYFFLSQSIVSKWKHQVCFCAFSDYQAIVLFPVCNAQGSGLWCLSNDLLKNLKYFSSICAAIRKFSHND